MNNSSAVAQNINTFFEIYSKALESHDSKTIVFLHQIPCTMLSDDAYTIFSDASKLEGFFNQGMAFYRQFGIVTVRADIWHKINITKKIARVRVNWQFFDSNNAPVYNCDYQYVLKADKHNHWRIVLSISVNEKERMEDWKAKKQPVVNS
ncbi:MAG: hypothetical protein H7257_02545 [Taibaiella sp.]|nr:hypothetical protein [Taibaiella sp.]